jgi:hypothetical protein
MQYFCAAEAVEAGNTFVAAEAVEAGNTFVAAEAVEAGKTFVRVCNTFVQRRQAKLLCVYAILLLQRRQSRQAKLLCVYAILLCSGGSRGRQNFCALKQSNISLYRENLL